jgi:hypothetical protein
VKEKFEPEKLAPAALYDADNPTLGPDPKLFATAACNDRGALAKEETPAGIAANGLDVAAEATEAGNNGDKPTISPRHADMATVRAMRRPRWVALFRPRCNL